METKDGLPLATQASYSANIGQATKLPLKGYAAAFSSSPVSCCILYLCIHLPHAAVTVHACFLACFLIIHPLHACTGNLPACTIPYIFVGVYLGDTKDDDQSLFITERHCFQDLLSGLASACPCGLAVNAWTFMSAVQVWSVEFSHPYGTVLCIHTHHNSIFFHCTCRKAMYSVFLLHAVVVGKAGSGQVQGFLVDII